MPKARKRNRAAGWALDFFARSSSREVRISSYPFSAVYFSRGTLPTQKRVRKGHY